MVMMAEVVVVAVVVVVVLLTLDDPRDLGSMEQTYLYYYCV